MEGHTRRSYEVSKGDFGCIVSYGFRRSEEGSRRKSNVIEYD